MSQSVNTRKKALSLLLTCILVACCNALHAQWAPIKNIYYGVGWSYGAAAFAINGKGYVLSGYSNGMLNQFDTAVMSWTTIGHRVSGAGIYHCMYFVINNKAYIVGGLDTFGSPTAAVWAFDPAAPVASRWTKKADFPGGMRAGGIGFAINNTGYVGCGFGGSGNFYKDLWEYNEAQDTWTPLPNPLPFDGVAFASTFVANSKSYVVGSAVIGGGPGATEVDRVWEFNPATKTWATKAAYPGGNRQATFAFSYGGYGYVGGGQTGGTATYQDMWRYNPAADNWTRMPDAPLSGTAWSSAFVIGDYAYAGLGARYWSMSSTGWTGGDSFYRFKITVPTSVGNIIRRGLPFKVFPSPAQNRLNLSGDIHPGDIYSICDATGKLLRRGKLQQNAVETTSLLPGAYLITIQSASGTNVARFTKE